MGKHAWGWMIFALLGGGWLPAASNSVMDPTAMEFFDGLPATLKARVHHVAVSRDAKGNLTRFVAFLGPMDEQVLPNPWLAAGLSLLIPGTGQAYLGDWPRGALFLGSSALLWGLALGLRDSNPTLGNAFGVGLLGISIAAPLDALWGAERCGAR